MTFTVYDGCVAVIGVIVGFYWARVLRLVRKTRIKTGRSAQLFPAEPLGRVLRVAWYPSVVLWCVHPWLTLGGVRGPGAIAPMVTNGWVAAGATCVAIVAMWGTLVCWRKMGTSWRMGINPGEKTELVVSGPYGYVRHPIYALQQVLVIASAVVVSSPVMVVCAGLMAGFLQWEARREERNLVKVHGEAYERYLRGTGRFVPRSVKAFVP